MARRHISRRGEWIVVSDAGPAFKTPARWGHMVAAYQVHRDSTANRPLAEGAAYLGDDTGINRAEYQAAIMGLRLVADRMYFGEWDCDTVNIVTDNAFVYHQGLGTWDSGDLRWHLERLEGVVGDLVDLTSELVYFWHATDEQNAGAHTLAANFPTVCDRRNREQWERQRLLLRWQAVRQHLRDHMHKVCAASLASGWVSAYNGKTLTLAFPSARSSQRERVEMRTDELQSSITAVMGKPLREVRCVEV